MRYSIFSLVRQAFAGHRGWDEAWRSPEPKKHYDVVIVGGGGHDLAFQPALPYRVWSQAERRAVAPCPRVNPGR